MVPKDRRLFMGDFIYRWAAILAAGVGSDVADFEKSTRKLIGFVDSISKNGQNVILSCGHVDDNLDPEYLGKFLKLLIQIRHRELVPSKIWGGNAVIFENEDKSLSFIQGKFPGLK